MQENSFWEFNRPSSGAACNEDDNKFSREPEASMFRFKPTDWHSIISMNVWYLLLITNDCRCRFLEEVVLLNLQQTTLELYKRVAVLHDIFHHFSLYLVSIRASPLFHHAHRTNLARAYFCAIPLLDPELVSAEPAPGVLQKYKHDPILYA